MLATAVIAALLCVPPTPGAVPSPPKSAPAAEKVGLRLTITLSTGKQVEFLDVEPERPEEVDGTTHRAYRGLVLDGAYHLVKVQFYEGGEYVLIDDRTGTQVRTPCVPEGSPDHRWAACAEQEYAYGELSVHVWRRTAAGLVSVLDTKETAIPGDLAWQGSTAFRVALADLCGRVTGFKTFALVGEQWALAARCGLELLGETCQQSPGGPRQVGPPPGCTADGRASPTVP